MHRPEKLEFPNTFVTTTPGESNARPLATLFVNTVSTEGKYLRGAVFVNFPHQKTCFRYDRFTTSEGWFAFTEELNRSIMGRIVFRKQGDKWARVQ